MHLFPLLSHFISQYGRVSVISIYSCKPTMNYQDVMELGFPEHTARDIIRQAKGIAVSKFEEARQSDESMVNLKRSPFDNRRIGIAPTEIVESLIGISLSKQLESGILE